MASMLLLSLFNLFFAAFHPFHVSVCEIEYNAERQTLQVTHKIFLDDLEDALALQYKTRPDLIRNLNGKEGEMVERYVTENFNLYVNSEKVAHTYIGHEQDGDAVWCFIEFKAPADGRSFDFNNRILTELFSDQTNILHMQYGEKTKSLRFNRKNTTGSLQFD